MLPHFLADPRLGIANPELVIEVHRGLSPLELLLLNLAVSEGHRSFMRLRIDRLAAGWGQTPVDQALASLEGHRYLLIEPSGSTISPLVRLSGPARSLNGSLMLKL